MSDHIGTEAGVEPAYGRFSRRLKAVLIDGVLMVLLMVGALIGTVSASSDNVGRILGFTVLVTWLLYEPLLVSLTGSTIGHYRTNLRVVDNRTHGNISFIKADARVIIKSVLGIYSFISMATTSRHQAVHDLLTQSTVQIRDRSQATSKDYIAARRELLNPAMPSTGRRILVIFAWVMASYMLALFVVMGLLLASLLILDEPLISDECLARDHWCSALENAMLWGFALAVIGIPVLCIVQGWRGRLYGCRIRGGSARSSDSARPALSSAPC